MNIYYLDGPRLSRALVAASRKLIQNTAVLDAINVFPVPDGDTGTNMASTVRSVAAAVSVRRLKHAGDVLREASRSALQGARGNSGAILAQFFSGLARELGNEARVGAKKLADAAVRAAEYTRKALSVPKDGTILTVLHDWALALREKASHTDDIQQVFMHAYERAKASLARTRETLPEMRRAGVVDAGACGFVHMLEGIVEFMRSGSLRQMRSKAASRTSAGTETDSHGSPDFLPEASRIPLEALETGSTFRYCTEALLMADSLDLGLLREDLGRCGDSIVVAGSETQARIHIHTDSPSRVFNVLENYGFVDSHKVDDMELQKRLAVRAQAGMHGCAIVVDTGCDLPEEYFLAHGIIKVPALITIDGKTRPDGPALDTASIHALMRERPDFSMSTSQPADTSFVRAFAMCAGHAREILYIGMTSALSGTFHAGVRAASRAGLPVVCFDSRTITAGEGPLVTRAVELAERGMKASDIVIELERLRKALRFFIAIPNLRSLIRSGRLHGVKSLILQKFGLRPLLTTDAEGKAKVAGLYGRSSDAVKALFARLEKAFPKSSLAEVHITHVGAASEAARLADLCRAHLDPASRIMTVDMGPVLASLGWLGALGLAAVPLDS